MRIDDLILIYSYYPLHIRYNCNAGLGSQENDRLDSETLATMPSDLAARVDAHRSATGALVNVPAELAQQIEDHKKETKVGSVCATASWNSLAPVILYTYHILHICFSHIDIYIYIYIYLCIYVSIYLSIYHVYTKNTYRALRQLAYRSGCGAFSLENSRQCDHDAT